MIYLLFACCLIIYMYTTYRLSKVKTHDQVLFPLCQLRRDIMSFLHENVVEKPGTLSPEEYASVRRLSTTLDDAIHNYNRHKTTMFNLRRMAKYLEQYRNTLKQAAPLELTDNPKIQELNMRFVLCSAKGFLAYTPLIRSELVLRLLAGAYRVGKKESKRRIAEYVIGNAGKVRDDARHHGFIDDAAAA